MKSREVFLFAINCARIPQRAWKESKLIRKCFLQKPHTARCLMISSNHCWFLWYVQTPGRFIPQRRRTLWCLRRINIMFKRTALEICVVCFTRKRDCLSCEWRERKRKLRKRIENVRAWSSKFASLLVYLMSTELTHFITHFSVAAHKI